MSKHSYFDLVYEVTRHIPVGRVSTYGAIADFLALGSARMVGWALNKSFLGDNVPAHRVVNRKGELSGRNFFPTPTMMEELLVQEGVKRSIRSLGFVLRESHETPPCLTYIF